MIYIPGSGGGSTIKLIDGSVDWEIIPKTLPKGFRMVATVDRPDGTTHDLGQNAEGNFALFRRSTDPWSENSHGPMDRLSDADLEAAALALPSIVAALTDESILKVITRAPKLVNIVINS